jgi:hypothetical protein
MKMAKSLLSILAFLTIILLIAQSVCAQAYKWVDDEGNMHFTDEYGQIPEKYREKIKKEIRWEEKTPDQNKSETQRAQLKNDSEVEDAFAQDQSATKRFRQEELDQMLAPIALYPDSLLAQILMAATYPLEVVQAEGWVKVNRKLKGDELNDGLDQKDWDSSVKALVPFPEVLSMMSENLEWTQSLGDAFLDQQGEVMDTVQRLRAKAQAAGNLRDTEEQKVIEEGDDIEIEPAQPDVVYEPDYDPSVIYGSWWYPAFPPFFFLPPPGAVIGFHGVMGFGRGVGVGRSWGYAWGHWDWRNHYINVNINRNININRNNIEINRTSIQTTQWQHDVSHRKGVSYGNEATRERYGQPVKGAETRRDFRGFGQETKYQQAPVPTRQSPVATQGLRVSGVTPGGPVEMKGREASVPIRPSPDLSRNKSAFAGMGRGSDVRIQSNRGLQSRQSMSSRGTGSVSQGNVGRRH